MWHWYYPYVFGFSPAIAPSFPLYGHGPGQFHP